MQNTTPSSAASQSAYTIGQKLGRTCRSLAGYALMGALAASASGCFLFGGSGAEEPAVVAAPEPKSVILFSDEPVTEQSKGSSVTSINLGDPLYISIPSQERCRRGIDIAARIGEEMIYFGFQLRLDGGKNPLSGAADRPFTFETTFDGDKKTGLNNEGLTAIRNFNTLVVPALKEGKNAVYMKVRSSCGRNDTLSEGTINITVGQGAQAAYAEKFGTSFPPSPHPENERLVALLAKTDFDPDGDFVGARVLSSESTAVRHNLTGLLTGNKFAAAVVLKHEGEDYCRLYHAEYHSDVVDGHIRYHRTLSKTRYFDPSPDRLYGMMACADAPK